MTKYKLSISPDLETRSEAGLAKWIGEFVSNRTWHVFAALGVAKWLVACVLLKLYVFAAIIAIIAIPAAAYNLVKNPSVWPPKILGNRAKAR